MKLNKTAITLLVCSTVFASSIALSQPGKDRRGGSFLHPRVVNELNLSAEQEELLGNLRSSNKESRDELATLRNSLNEKVMSDEYSYSETESIVRQLTELQYQNLLARSEAQQAFYQSLSDEQKAFVIEAKEKGKSRRSRF